jgi:hypothetical protein
VEQKRSVEQTPLDLARCLFDRSFSLHTAQSAARLLGGPAIDARVAPIH